MDVAHTVTCPSRAFLDSDGLAGLLDERCFIIVLIPYSVLLKHKGHWARDAAPCCQSAPSSSSKPPPPSYEGPAPSSQSGAPPAHRAHAACSATVTAPFSRIATCKGAGMRAPDARLQAAGLHALPGASRSAASGTTHLLPGRHRHCELRRAPRQRRPPGLVQRRVSAPGRGRRRSCAALCAAGRRPAYPRHGSPAAGPPSGAH